MAGPSEPVASRKSRQKPRKPSKTRREQGVQIKLTKLTKNSILVSYTLKVLYIDKIFASTAKLRPALFFVNVVGWRVAIFDGNFIILQFGYCHFLLLLYEISLDDLLITLITISRFIIF